MTGLVLDASAFVFAFTETSAEARFLRTRIADARCHAPHLVDAEVGSVARSKLLRRELDPAQAFGLVDGVARIIQRRYRHVPLARLAWSLRDNVTGSPASGREAGPAYCSATSVSRRRLPGPPVTESIVRHELAGLGTRSSPG